MSTKDERLRAIDLAVFRTITAADFAAMFARERRSKNPVREQIRAEILRRQKVNGTNALPKIHEQRNLG